MNSKNIMVTLYLFSLLFIISNSQIQSNFNPYGELEVITIGDGRSLTVGIISDSQLNASLKEVDLVFTHHLERSLDVLKEHNIDVLIFVGDISNSGTNYAFNTFKQLFDKVFKDQKPILNIIMGNHDFWAGMRIPFIQQKRFYDEIGEKPSGHKIINGFHFINWSSSNGVAVFDYLDTHWANKEIKKAVNEDPKKPVFVVTHFAPKGTMYGSDKWGTRKITKVLKKYPQVISLSGHSHFSLIDERSIWQGEFTAIQTQATAYIELEKGKENGPVPRDEFDSTECSRSNYMGLIMNVNSTQVGIKRISLEKNNFYGEPWTIDIPISKDNFKYEFKKRKEIAKAPVFEGDKTITIIYFQKDIYQIKFKQALHENFVHSYRIVISNQKTIKEYLYFSDFYLLKEDRKEYITLKLPQIQIEIAHSILIYAIESFGKESEPIEAIILLHADNHS